MSRSTSSAFRPILPQAPSFSPTAPSRWPASPTYDPSQQTYLSSCGKSSPSPVDRAYCPTSPSYRSRSPEPPRRFRSLTPSYCPIGFRPPSPALPAVAPPSYHPQEPTPPPRARSLTPGYSPPGNPTLPTYSPSSPTGAPTGPAQPKTPKRVRWDKTLAEECEDAMQQVHEARGSSKRYRAMHLIAKVLVHVANGTENSSAGMHVTEMMRGMGEL